MSTWYQDKAGNNKPVPHPTQWSVFTNPENDMCSTMRFGSEEQAREYYRRVIEKTGQTKRPQLIPPQYLDIIRQAQTAQIDPCELDEIVHEMKAAEAADINNSGLSGQIEYLADCFASAKQLVDHINDMKVGKFPIVGYDE